MNKKTEPEKSYRDSFSGYFSGMLQWKQFDTLWDTLKTQTEGWYVYQPLSGEEPPARPMDAEAFLAFLDEAETFLHEEQFADYCGAVYVNDTQAPAFIKIFHPRKMGSGCSLGGENHEPILPHWTLSKVRPTRMRPPPSPAIPQDNKGFLRTVGEKIGLKK